MTLGWMLIWCVTLNKSFISLGFMFLTWNGEGSWDHPSPCLLDWLRIQGSFLHPAHLLVGILLDSGFVTCSFHSIRDLTPSHSIRSGILAWSHKIHINFSLKIQSYLAKIFIGNFLGGCFALWHLLFYPNSPRPHFNLYIGTTGTA